MGYKIYKYENMVNGKVYIGQTSQTLKERSGKNGSNYKRTPKFHSAITKYGWDNFEVEVLYESDSPTNIDWMEKMFINEYNSTKRDFGYNLEAGGNDKKTISEETRKKLSESHKGKTPNEHTRKKMSDAQKGRTHSEETRKKMSDVQKGRIISEETRKKLSEVNKGKTYPHRRKPIKATNIKTGEVLYYASTTDACDDRCYMFRQGPISICCNGKGKTHRGFKWEYI